MSVVNSLQRYFDISRQPIAIATATPKKYIMPQYISLVAGIIIQPFLDHFMQSSTWDVSWQAIGARFVFGLIIGIVIFPATYRNSFDNTSPMFVQLCTIFTAGLGWQTLFTTAVKATTNLTS